MLRNYYLITASLLIALVSVYYSFHAAASLQVEGTSEPANEETIDDAKPDSYNKTVLKLARGQSLSGLLLSSGYSAGIVFDIVDSLGKVLNMRRIPEGQEVFVKSAEDGWIEEVELKVNFDRFVRAKYDGNAWLAEEDVTETYAIPTFSIATIEDSLFKAARDDGVPASVVMEAIGLFGFNVDFQRDIKPGDRVIIIYEKLYNYDDKYMSEGKLIHAKLEGNERNVEFWEYTRLDKETGYYELDGKSVQKTLLKTPVNGARISSGFGYRKIPALNFSGLHHGVDFAVRTGTPVMAAGDGRVQIAGWHNTYGLRVKLSHVNHYDTMYAHLSRIADGIYTGAWISQGQVIGYVGSTGMSTGPHCHYEVHYYGTPVDPLKLEFPPQYRLDAEDIERLNSKRDVLSAHFGL